MRKSALALGGIGLALAAPGVLRRLRQEDLSGQVALVTGGSRGLGLLLARELARAGCRIAICARDERELERARESLEARGTEVLAAPCDVSRQAEVVRMVDAVLGRFGRVDVLVNNAGMIRVGPLEAMTLEDFEEALGVMFWGVLHPTLALLPQMLARRSGRIVNVTSIGGRVSVPHLLPYACAKFAAVGLSEGLRAELAPRGIRVTTIVPGLMRTGSYLNASFKGRQEAELTWFGLGASLPLISIDAERAARQIVAATKRGDPERVFPLPASLLARFHGLFPGVTADLLGIVSRILPSGTHETGAEPARGMDVQERVGSALLDSLTRWGREAARRFHQYPGPLECCAQDRDVESGTEPPRPA